MGQYDLGNIEKLRIHELRDFARKVGVPSPTTLRKEELIDRISELFETDDGTLSSKYAPKKEPLDFFALLTSSNPKILDELLIPNSKTEIVVNDNGRLSNTLVMKSTQVEPMNNFVYQTNNGPIFDFAVSQNFAQYDSEVSQVEGYLDIHPNGFGILRGNGYMPDARDSYVTLAHIRKHNLRKGDYIHGKAKSIIENKPRILFEVLDVAKDMDSHNSCNFDDFAFKKTDEKLYLDKFNLNIVKGDRLYIKNMPISEVIKLAYDIVDENSARCKVVNVKALPEETYDSHQKLEVINCMFNQTEEDLVATVELLLERIKREFEDGKPNVLILYNFSELIKQFNIAIDGNYNFDKYSAKAINKIANILYTAKYSEQFRYVTIVCIDNQEIPKEIDSVMKNAFLPLLKVIEMNK